MAPRIRLLTLVLAALVAVASAASAPTFCKCTCFKNSTIIPLGPASQAPGSPEASPEASRLQRSLPFDSLLRRRLPAGPRPPVDPRPQSTFRNSDGNGHSRRSASTSCSECTKAFCLGQGIDFCKHAEEENVVTMCFQRDSNKDKYIVWGFIMGTVGLLAWAAFKHVVEWRDGRAMTRQDVSYAPVTGGR